MSAGRPPKTNPGTLYFFANDFYWTFRQISEGHFHWKHDEEEYKQLIDEIDAKGVDLNQDQMLAIARFVEGEIVDGRLDRDDRNQRLRQLKRDNIFATREGQHFEAGEQTRKRVRVPGKPEVLKKIMDADTPEKVRAICKDAFEMKTIEIDGIKKEVRRPNWPIPPGSMLPQYLSDHAEDFISAKSHKRFPNSGRPMSQLKQLWFLSRALAGAVFGIKWRTSINLVGSIRPEQTFQSSRNAKLPRKRRKRN